MAINTTLPVRKGVARPSSPLANGVGHAAAIASKERPLDETAGGPFATTRPATWQSKIRQSFLRLPDLPST
jgi:hypothetical protein